MTLHIATTNPGKVHEFSTSAKPHGIAILPLPGLEGMPVPVEDATTFAGNAELKARAYSVHAPGLLVLADDSGLEIDALSGRPGIHSARFADQLHFAPDAGLSKDQRNNGCVLSLLHKLERADGGAVTRRSRFVCALALARDGEVLLRAHGEVEGELLDEPRGTNGFGYDPLFLLPRLGRSMAELSGEEKWDISHRGNAFRALLVQLGSA